MKPLLHFKKIFIIILVLIAGRTIVNAQTVNLQWAKRLGGTQYDNSSSVAVDNSGNVYTAGVFNGTADFDPSAASFDLSSFGLQDIFVSKLDASGNLVWAKQFGGVSNDMLTAMTIDTAGNVYLTGFFQATADFDPSAATFNLICTGIRDIFVCKLDASGNLVWAKQFAGTSDEEGHSIAVDASGNVYTVGYFTATVDFDPGAGVHNLTTAGSDDIFISKLDASGNFVWVRQMGGPAGDLGGAIALDAAGNIYTTGLFFGTSDFDPGTGTHNLISNGNCDIYVSKLDTAGNFVWANQIGGLQADAGVGITADAMGNVYVTGYFDSNVDFDPGAGVYQLISFGSFDIFLLKLNATGNFVWAKRMGSPLMDAGTSVALDASGNIYTTGYFSGTVDFDPGAGVSNLTSFGNTDVFLSKLDTAGVFAWAQPMGGTAADFATHVFVDASNNIYVTGFFDSTADFDPGAGTNNLTSAGGQDVFVAKLSQVTGIANNHSSRMIKVYPNPADNYIVITKAENGNYAITDVSGKIMMQGEINSSKQEIDIAALSEGIYLLQVRDKAGWMQTIKIVKE